MNTTSSLNHCLFCLSSVPPEPSGNLGVKLNIPGAGNCELLNKQLEQLFIVEKLLDIPREGCVKLISRDEMNTSVKREFVQRDGGKGSSPLQQEKWFNLCETCTRKWVKPAWEAYQKLVAAETKIRGIKETIKKTMKQQILKKRRSKTCLELTREGADTEIRQCIFPELFRGSKNAKESITKVEPRPRPSYKEDQDPLEVLQHPESPSDIDWEPPPDLDDDHFDDPDDIPSPPLPPPSRISSKSTSRKRVTSALRLIRRVRRREPVENPKRFLCTHCGCYFLTNDDLNSHLEAHEQSKQNGGGPHDCVQCTYPARTAKELQFHMTNRHARVRYYRCPKCSFKGKSWKKTKAHLTEEHHADLTQEDLESPEISLKCPVCSRQFLRLETFTIHQRKMHPELFGASEEPCECPECGRKFMSKILLEHHVTNEHSERPSQFVCDECGRGFRWKCRLDDHMTMHNKAKRDFVCHLCGVDYWHPGMLTQHYRKVHPGETEAGGVKSESATSGGDTSQEFKCRYCNLTSPYQVVIRRHLKTHKEETGNKCEQCGNCFMTKQSLRRHIRLNHPVVKETVPCPHCLKPFPNMDYMKDHIAKYCRLKNVDTQTSAGPADPGPSIISTTSLETPQEQKQEHFAPPPTEHDQYFGTVDIKMIFP